MQSTNGVLMNRRKLIRKHALIIDHRTKLKEKDRILTLVCDDGTQRQAIAKGALKPGGRFAGVCEFAHEADFLLAEGTSLDIVQEAVSICPHKTLRELPDAFAAACVVCELARYTTFPDLPNPFMFNICSRTLSLCETINSYTVLLALVVAYTFKVLAHEGYRPILSSCIYCGEADIAYFSATSGGSICTSCAHDIDGLSEITPSEVQFLEFMLGSVFDKIIHTDYDPKIMYNLGLLAHQWAATHLDVRLRAFEFFLQI